MPAWMTRLERHLSVADTWVPMLFPRRPMRAVRP